ncbi:MAG: radical SAM protein [Gammaproteobacteria bacterium]|nr:radical SAM protein [Gammaproteobacteria bacterium]
MTDKLRVVLIKPSKYAPDGTLDRYRVGYLPNATLYHIASLTPAVIRGVPVEVRTIDEYVYTDLDYLRLLHAETGVTTLLALVGVQSHQFHRALDLAAYARAHGVEHCVIGGPHPMTCDTSMLQGKGVSFALAEAELIWERILHDALDGELQGCYGADQRWASTLDGPIINPPPPEDLERYWSRMLGIYPVRGCPYRCNFCSVIKISGRQVRSPNIETTIESLKRAEAAGVERIIFVSDNFNKFPEVKDLLEAMIAEKLKLRFFCQCDTQIAKQPDVVELLGKAGCFEIFLGVESLNRETLKAMHKHHNRPEQYKQIIEMCAEFGVPTHFSNIIGFPDQRGEDIREHLDTLREIGPPVASFYILTPIPGTEQYDDYRRDGLLVDTNLDRYDTTCLTWNHPHMSREEVADWLFWCYERFYASLLRKGSTSDEQRNLAVFNYLSAKQRMHPNAGGLRQTRLDTVDDYIDYRIHQYGYDQVPLPDSLTLSPADEATNRKAKLKAKLAV